MVLLLISPLLELHLLVVLINNDLYKLILVKSGNAPFGTRLCLQSVVRYTLCRRCRENAVAAGEGKGVFEAAGKQGCDCVA